VRRESVSGCRYGVDAAGMVVTSGPRDCSVAGSAQLGKRSSQKRAWSCRWELALAHLGAYLLAITAAAIGYAFVAVTIYLCCGYADRLASKVGPTGTNVILKLSAFLVVCIGVQILWNGASKLLSSLPQFGGVGALPR